ncbi:MAG: YjbQ family protein [Actinobacteria bacterium]|nr:YjbQ family protein [Actinomycetota bacterium]
MLEAININSSRRIEMINITPVIETSVKKSGIKNGICFLHIPHTTAALTINENADPDVPYDIIKKIERLIPKQDNYTHSEGNSDAHIKSSFFGPTINLMIDNGKIILGLWQCVYFCEFDGPRSRKLFIKIIKEI